MRLKEDVRSLFNPETLYGKQGDDVEMISDCGNVCIVQSKDGNKFPVRTELLTEQKIDRKTEAVPDTTADKKTIINRVPVSKKVAPINQKSLFDE